MHLVCMSNHCMSNKDDKCHSLHCIKESCYPSAHGHYGLMDRRDRGSNLPTSGKGATSLPLYHDRPVLHILYITKWWMFIAELSKLSVPCCCIYVSGRKQFLKFSISRIKWQQNKNSRQSLVNQSKASLITPVQRCYGQDFALTLHLLYWFQDFFLF